jgi:hypothetical protein
MAFGIQETPIFPVGSLVQPGGTEAAPHPSGLGPVVGPFADYAATFAYRITNGANAPGSGLTLVFYGVSGDRMYEIDRVYGDTSTNSGPPPGVIPCPAGFAQFTARAFGNTVSPVGVEVYLERQVS